jgi:hypothetical protein
MHVFVSHQKVEKEPLKEDHLFDSRKRAISIKHASQLLDRRIVLGFPVLAA